LLIVAAIPTMSVQEHVGNEKSCVWHASYFSDVELKDELFCIRFPSIERKGERERKGDLDQYECVDGDRNVTSRLLAVKKPYDERFLRIYNFLWDRMRAIRMDLRMKHIFNQSAIIMLEQMTSKSYKKTEVTLHNKRTDCWIIIKNMVYDVTSYVEEHPGGVATMLLHDLPYTEDRISRVHVARRLVEYFSDNSLDFPVIHHIQFPNGIHRDDLVIGAGSHAGAVLVDGLMLLEDDKVGSAESKNSKEETSSKATLDML
ncbi:hypothetical protein TSUD_238180, partial [Trifolium subterraneum]